VLVEKIAYFYPPLNAKFYEISFLPE